MDNPPIYASPNGLCMNLNYALNLTNGMYVLEYMREGE